LRFSHAFQAAIRHHLDRGHPVSLITLDIDHFKKVNDKWGHASGDAVLKLLAQVCQSSVRPADTVARLGGEEFGILLPGMGLHDAAAVAERLRVALSDSRCAPVNQADGSRLPGNEPIRFTASFGVAEFLADGAKSLEGLLRTADARLYQAKGAGRNRVVSGNTPGSTVRDTHQDHAAALACVEVARGPEGSWTVALSGSKSAPVCYATEEHALSAGWQLAKQHGLALRIHGADGMTRERHIYDHASRWQHCAAAAGAIVH
jgi:diguanylate cyclase (GGDEF)-like protein